MLVHLSIDQWDVQQAAAKIIRESVFIKEQGVPVDMEWDDMDVSSIHVLAYVANDSGEQIAIGTARLLPDGYIGRMAVLKDYRGQGVGSKMLGTLMQYAKFRGDMLVKISAQLSAVDFYKRHGFTAFGDVYLEAGIAHIFMQCDFV